MAGALSSIRNRRARHKGSLMVSWLRTLVHDEPDGVRGRIIALYALLLGFNLAAWAWAFAAFHRFPVLLGTAFLAYSFGLRHAVDADHIAAIDNVTRKLMQQGKRPVSVGLMFSLGHSTIVVVGSVAIAAAALALQHRMDAVRAVGGVVGTLVSALFLFAIAFVNLVVLLSVYRSFLQACGAANPTTTRTSTCSWAIAASWPAFSAPCST